MDLKDYFSGKKMVKKDGLIILVLLGIFLYVVCIPTNNNICSSKNTLVNMRGNTSGENDHSEEKRLKSFLEKVPNAGEVEVLVNQNKQSKNPYSFQEEKYEVTSVIVLAQGADSTEVRLAMMELITVLYHIDCSKVCIRVMK